MLRGAVDGDVAVGEFRADRRKRQFALLCRTSKTVAKDIQPRKRHRRSALQWLAAVDNQMMMSTGKSFMHFRIPSDLAKAGPPESWPRLSVAPDQGGDGLCAVNFLSRSLGCNVDLTPDMSHGINNDVWQAFQDMGVKPQMLLWLIAFNVPMGPHLSDSRHQEIKLALQDLFRNHEPQETPLFVAMAPAMLSEAAFADLNDVPDPLGALWERLATESP